MQPDEPANPPPTPTPPPSAGSAQPVQAEPRPVSPTGFQDALEASPPTTQTPPLVSPQPASQSYPLPSHTSPVTEDSEPAVGVSPTQEEFVADVSDTGSGWRSFFSTAFLFIGAFAIAILLNTFVFQSYEVDGMSMEPTLQHSDRLIIYKLDRTIASITRDDYIPNRGDVIVFHKPNGTSDQLIKRVIGLPGDRVVVKNEKITVYNEQNPDGFNPDDAPYGADLPPTYGNVDVRVGEGEVFVCGDNRIPGASLDSRSMLGNVPADYIVGKLVLRYLPVGNIQTF